jgi:hypothetical protein
MIPIPKCVFDIAQRIESENEPRTNHQYGYLNRTDLFLVAISIADPNSKFFFTTDRKLLKSQVLTKYCKKDFEICNGVKRNTTLHIKSGIKWLYDN